MLLRGEPAYRSLSRRTARTRDPRLLSPRWGRRAVGSTPGPCGTNRRWGVVVGPEHARASPGRRRRRPPARHTPAQATRRLKLREPHRQADRRLLAAHRPGRRPLRHGIGDEVHLPHPQGGAEHPDTGSAAMDLPTFTRPVRFPRGSGRPVLTRRTAAWPTRAASRDAAFPGTNHDSTRELPARMNRSRTAAPTIFPYALRGRSSTSTNCRGRL